MPEPTTSFSPQLEAKLTAFLDAAPHMRETLAGIALRQQEHDAEHRALDERLDRDTKSYHFRLSSLEAVAGRRGWVPTARVALLIVLAACGGYAVRATRASDGPPAAASAVR